MKQLALLCWFLLPLIAYAYHHGPGQDQIKMDEVALNLQLADRSIAKYEDYESAILHYENALSALPKEHVAEARRIRLEKTKAMMQAHKLPQANADLRGLVDELVADKLDDSKIGQQARAALANSQYYMTWLMRLEGVSRDHWEPEIEAARQSLKLLAEKADETGDTKAAKSHTEDLESVIRLARMDLKELQGLPLPSQ